MRVSIGNVLSMKEQTEFNRVALYMLQAIRELLQIPEGVNGDAFVFIFKKMIKDSAYIVANPIILHGADPCAPIVYFPPDGCNMDDVFECLYYEVLKLAYVMTNGEINEENGPNLVVKTVNDVGPVITYTMRFVRHF